MSSVCIDFLPPNTTPRMQPVDAGIIAGVNIHYLTFQMGRALDLVDEHSKNIYRVDILTALRALKQI